MHGVHQFIHLLHLGVFQGFGVGYQLFIREGLISIGRSFQRAFPQPFAQSLALAAHGFAQIGLFHPKLDDPRRGGSQQEPYLHLLHGGDGGILHRAGGVQTLQNGDPVGVHPAQPFQNGAPRFGFEAFFLFHVGVVFGRHEPLTQFGSIKGDAMLQKIFGKRFFKDFQSHVMHDRSREDLLHQPRPFGAEIISREPQHGRRAVGGEPDALERDVEARHFEKGFHPLPFSRRPRGTGKR